MNPPGRPRSLLALPAPEAQARCATGAPVCVHVDPVEYHGPHLSLHNDRVVSHGLIDGLHPRVAPDHDHLFGTADLGGPAPWRRRRRDRLGDRLD